MRSSGTRALVALGFSVLFGLTAACGGSTPEAKAPGADPTDAPRVGSSAPDLTSDTSNASTTPVASPEAPKATAVSSSDNGSDIIPPFTSGKDPATKKAGPGSAGKGSKKTAGKKPKKKAAGA
jgi:hypothetical protein